MGAISLLSPVLIQYVGVPYYLTARIILGAGMVRVFRFVCCTLVTMVANLAYIRLVRVAQSAQYCLY